MADNAIQETVETVEAPERAGRPMTVDRALKAVTKLRKRVETLEERAEKAQREARAARTALREMKALADRLYAEAAGVETDQYGNSTVPDGGHTAYAASMVDADEQHGSDEDESA